MSAQTPLTGNLAEIRYGIFNRTNGGYEDFGLPIVVAANFKDDGYSEYLAALKRIWEGK